MNSLLFYIGNGLLKCAMVHNLKGSLPEVLFWQKMEIRHPETITQEELKKTTIQALDQLCQTSKKRLFSPEIKNKRITKLFCIFSSPWYISETKVLKTHKLEPFLIKDDTVMEFIQVANTEAEKGQEVLERKIIRVNLNGYVTQNPIGKRANTLEVSVVESFTDKNFLNDVRQIIDRYFGVEEKHFHSLPLASFAVIRNIFKHQENFLMINITSLLTEVSLIKDGLLHETVTLPIGSQKIIDMVVNRLNVTNAVAETLFQLYQGDYVENAVNKKLTEIIDEFKKAWTENLDQALSHLSIGLSLPPNCYLICQTPLRHFFSDFTKEKFKVETISETSFSPFVRFNNQGTDFSVAIMVLFANINL